MNWKVLTLTTTLATTALITPQVVAADRYGLGCLGNDTNHTIYYIYKWGDGEWIGGSVRPRHWSSHFWTYDYVEPDKSPNFTIQFNSGLSGNYFVTTYSLERSAVPEIDCNNYG